MHRFLISFDDGSMDHISEAELPSVGESAHAVAREAKAAGVWIFGGGVLRQRASIVAVEGTIAEGPVPETKAVIGGFSILEVSSREEALAWAEARRKQEEEAETRRREHERIRGLRARYDEWETALHAAATGQPPPIAAVVPGANAPERLGMPPAAGVDPG